MHEGDVGISMLTDVRSQGIIAARLYICVLHMFALQTVSCATCAVCGSHAISVHIHRRQFNTNHAVT